VCSSLSQVEKKSHKGKKTKYYCPYCHHALFQWKQRKECTIYKCCNHNCLYRVRNISKLNEKEKELREKKTSQFKLCYQYREYHYKPNQLTHAGPENPAVDLARIHNGPHVLGLILTFYVSFALSARKTAQVLKSVFSIPVSYQTVLNYAAAAAFYCHSFNLGNKGPINDISTGDEAYIKVMGKHHYVFFFVSSQNLKITAYHVADTRETLPAIIAMKEAIRTADPNQPIMLVTDGNPSYPAGIHFLNAQRPNHLAHRKVLGLQNLDSESQAYRPYKQLIERLNRTFKHHVRPAHGFSSVNGAIALVTLFVTHYNFLRPHTSLNWQVPVPMAQLQGIDTIQGKWAKILSLAA
jgi:putative transposase